jgi:hypothetical protein
MPICRLLIGKNIFNNVCKLCASFTGSNLRRQRTEVRKQIEIIEPLNPLGSYAVSLALFAAHATWCWPLAAGGW